MGVAGVATDERLAGLDFTRSTDILSISGAVTEADLADTEEVEDIKLDIEVRTHILQVMWTLRLYAQEKLSEEYGPVAAVVVGNQANGAASEWHCKVLVRFWKKAHAEMAAVGVCGQNFGESTLETGFANESVRRVRRWIVDVSEW